MTGNALSRWQIRAIVRISHQLNIASQNDGDSTVVCMIRRYSTGKVTLKVLDGGREETLRDPKYDG
jgi:hypothetical protein